MNMNYKKMNHLCQMAEPEEIAGMSKMMDILADLEHQNRVRNRIGGAL